MTEGNGEDVEAKAPKPNDLAEGEEPSVGVVVDVLNGELRGSTGA